MKFLHTSDWHLGRQFHNVSLLDDQKAVIEQLIQTIRHTPVDAVIVAGDIYDRSVPPTAAIELLNHTVDVICGELETPMIIIPGNHDGAKRLGFGATQMKQSGLHIISSFDEMLSPVILESKTAGRVAFHGMPYSDPEIVRHHFSEAVSNHDEAHEYLANILIERFDAKHKNVLISHCYIDGAVESESERPLSIGGSDRVSFEHFTAFDYVALGHLHQPQKKGKDYIRYSGSLMKYSFSEQHQKKGVTLVEFDENGFKSTEHIDLTAPHQMRILEGELDELLSQGHQDSNSHDYLLVRLTDTHAILDPMEKLRKVYPNVLHIEKPGMLIGEEQQLGKARLARGEIDMFQDFFLEAQKTSLTDEQNATVLDIISALHKEKKD
ncbi:exonuclease SbcCD subunit D [Vibrio sp. 10N.261.55.A7]|uniref:exonuclease SbcCD subunit D n=1 Tax=Vibrio sp. 10N.261.55.A7 TaxID=1880851 RepID=UPI000C84ABC7|nr:exonuclease SbcCD subunit D [Vibrio sp. 10N.261.55.A7]PMJ97193.1 exonuclease sbcCD subunit D [Vibrio sp. 10N.261.55.A7]